MDDTFSKTRLRQGQSTPPLASAATRVHPEEEQLLLDEPQPGTEQEPPPAPPATEK